MTSPRWVLLEVGETIREGDESLRPRLGHDAWRPVAFCIGEPRSENHPPIRRRWSPPAAQGDGPLYESFADDVLDGLWKLGGNDGPAYKLAHAWAEKNRAALVSAGAVREG